MGLENKDNSQEDFISNEEHKSRMQRIKAYVNKSSIENSSIINIDNESEGKDSNTETLNSDNKPKLEPIPYTSHLDKRKAKK